MSKTREKEKKTLEKKALNRYLYGRKKSHRKETRVFPGNKHVDFCTEPGCELRGKRRAQGICYSISPLTGMRVKSFETARKYAVEWLNEAREIHKKLPKELWIGFLEGAYVTQVMNMAINLDECVLLRAENTRLKNKLGIYD